MFRSISVIFLLIILADTFYSSTVSRAELQVSKQHIRRCRCKAIIPNGKVKCRKPLAPKNHVQQQELIKCFCSKTNQHKFPEFKAACATWRPGFPIPLM